MGAIAPPFKIDRPIAVTLSARQLRDKDLLKTARGAGIARGLDRRPREIEIPHCHFAWLAHANEILIQPVRPAPPIA